MNKARETPCEGCPFTLSRDGQELTLLSCKIPDIFVDCPRPLGTIARNTRANEVTPGVLSSPRKGDFMLDAEVTEADGLLAVEADASLSFPEFELTIWRPRHS